MIHTVYGRLAPTQKVKPSMADHGGCLGTEPGPKSARCASVSKAINKKKRLNKLNRVNKKQIK